MALALRRQWLWLSSYPSRFFCSVVRRRAPQIDRQTDRQTDRLGRPVLPILLERLMDHFSSFPAIPRLAVATFTAIYTVPTPTTLRNCVPSSTFIHRRMKKLLLTCSVVQLTALQTALQEKRLRDKREVNLIVCYEGTQWVQLYSFLNLGVTWEWVTPRTSRFTTGNNPPYRRLGAPHDRTGRVEKILPLAGFDSRAVEPVASRYTDWTIPAHWSPKYDCSDKKIDARHKVLTNKLHVALCDFYTSGPRTSPY